ncbi:hypothetical protein PISMIDRAFT_15837 [Pisolithus microcarpus 441]|uniref:Uncharacterized protein n=1 Tax=Pisolithus microcarpus 441 TaxID=765257 RepID=A0A0C9XVF0_9AGAM|nr:hypothetical protein PISMIDRAFT_15837 [Pisolithus microcarpus 441]
MELVNAGNSDEIVLGLSRAALDPIGKGAFDIQLGCLENAEIPLAKKLSRDDIHHSLVFLGGNGHLVLEFFGPGTSRYRSSNPGSNRPQIFVPHVSVK